MLVAATAVAEERGRRIRKSEMKRKISLVAIDGGFCFVIVLVLFCEMGKTVAFGGKGLTLGSERLDSSFRNGKFVREGC